MKAWIRQWLDLRQQDNVLPFLALITAQSEALRDLAKQQQMTLDRVIADRFERPVRQSVEVPQHVPMMDASDMVDVLMNADDQTFEAAIQ